LINNYVFTVAAKCALTSVYGVTHNAGAVGKEIDENKHTARTLRRVKFV